MRWFGLWLAFAVCVVGQAPSARGQTVWQWTHDAGGEGTAHVFDGGVVVFDSGHTLGPDDPWMSFLASDYTPSPGVLQADYTTGARSSIDAFFVELDIFMDFSTSYVADRRIGADRPGGEGCGSMWSVIEFLMPADELEWHFFFLIRQDDGFSGSAHVVVENVTRSETLLDLTEGFTPGELMTLSGEIGDLIRISFTASGEGSVPPGVPSYSGFDVILISEFTFADCNGNFFPDQQDVLSGTSEDCNANSLPDECDIADGRSLDVFPPRRGGDGIPDECQIRTPDRIKEPGISSGSRGSTSTVRKNGKR